jgi:hypothetical protein
MVLKASHRPTALDITNVITLSSAIKEIKPENIGIVFTFVDQDPKVYTLEKQEAFIKKLSLSVDMFTLPEKSNLFLFKGKPNEPLCAETKKEEINDWINSILP